MPAFGMRPVSAEPRRARRRFDSGALVEPLRVSGVGEEQAYADSRPQPREDDMMSWRVAVYAAAFVLGASPLALAQSTTSPSSTSSTTGQSATEGSGASSQMSTAENDLIMKLQRDGYARVRDIRSTAEGTTAKAMK